MIWCTQTSRPNNYDVPILFAVTLPAVEFIRYVKIRYVKIVRKINHLIHHHGAVNLFVIESMFSTVISIIIMLLQSPILSFLRYDKQLKKHYEIISLTCFSFTLTTNSTINYQLTNTYIANNRPASIIVLSFSLDLYSI